MDTESELRQKIDEINRALDREYRQMRRENQKFFEPADKELRSQTRGVWVTAGIISALAALIFLTTIALSHATEIDMSKIAMIESSGNPGAWNRSDDSRGLFQLREIVVREWNNYHELEPYAFDDVWDPVINKRIASWYMNERCSQFVRAYDLPDDTLTRIALYNWGVGNVRRWVKSGARFADLPLVTQKYYLKYHGRLQ